MQSQKFSIRKRLMSFRYAGEGIYRFFWQEHNARIHLMATVVVGLAAWLFNVSRMELIALVAAIGGVWITEMLNTCIEKMADLISLEVHPEIKFIKDLAAGAVLVAAVVAVIIGFIIFIPKIL